MSGMYEDGVFVENLPDSDDCPQGVAVYDSPAKSALSELDDLDAQSNLTRMWQKARKSLNVHNVDCVQEEAIDLMSVVLAGLGIAPSPYDPSHSVEESGLIEFVQTVFETAIMASGHFATGRGEKFDPSELSEDETYSTIQVGLPTLSGLTKLPE